ncbi:hypothetical protein [Streptomyces sp. NPDC002156]
MPTCPHLAPASANSISLVTLDGSWTDADTDGHWEEANRYLDDLDAETVIVNVLCHC